MVNIGFGNLVNTGKVIAVVSPDSAPSKRLIQNAKDEGRTIDATQGRKTKAIIIMADDHVVLSALAPDTLAGRFNGNNLQGQDETDE